MWIAASTSCGRVLTSVDGGHYKVCFKGDNNCYGSIGQCVIMLLLSMGQGKSFKESLKALEADIQHANTL